MKKTKSFHRTSWATTFRGGLQLNKNFIKTFKWRDVVASLQEVQLGNNCLLTQQQSFVRVPLSELLLCRTSAEMVMDCKGMKKWECLTVRNDNVNVRDVLIYNWNSKGLYNLPFEMGRGLTAGPEPSQSNKWHHCLHSWLSLLKHASLKETQPRGP